MNRVHTQYLGRADLEGPCILECLHEVDHGGPPYTPKEREQRGFGSGLDQRARAEQAHEYAPRPLRTDPIETNADGGSQSAIPHTFTTLPLTALAAISQLQKLGDNKYGAHNWRLIRESDHLNHAFAHLLGHCTGDRTEDHLLHAAWRLLAALEVRLTRSTFYEEGDGVSDD